MFVVRRILCFLRIILINLFVRQQFAEEEGLDAAITKLLKIQLNTD